MPWPGQLPGASVRERRYVRAISCSVIAGIGTPYQISQRDIDATKQFSSHNERPFVSAGHATRDLILQNDSRKVPSSRECAAMERLSTALRNARCSVWHPDLVIKCFFDLDILFFGGVLRGNICFDWGDPDLMNACEQTSGELLGITRFGRPGRAKIFLNARRIFLDSLESDHLKTLFATTLHEMCHAFELVRVGPGGYRSSGHSHGRHGRHGLHFGSRIRAVHRNAKDLLGLVAVEGGEYFRCGDASRYWA